MEEPQYSQEEWEAFLQSIGEDQALASEIMQRQEDAAHFFESLQEQVASEIADNLNFQLPAGYVIDKYQITEEIGRGGMAVVYKARRIDELFDQEVAIKLMAPSFHEDKSEAYFITERQLLARLQHSGIAHIYDGGVADMGLPYFVMEYIDGKPINHFIADGKLSLERKLALFLKVLEAVQYAHGQLVLHRDIKPANVLVKKDGEVKLLDFGIGKFVSHAEEEDSRVGGTINYASPEQIANQTLTLRSDIYQLGILLLELVAELPLHESLERAQMVADKHSGAIIAARLSRLSIRADLKSIIHKCLQPRAGARYPSVDLLRLDLENYLQKQPVSAYRAGWYYPASLYARRNWISTTLVVVIFLLTAASAVINAVQIKISEQERQKVERTNEFLMRIFDANDPMITKGEEVTALTLLRKSEKEIMNIQDEYIQAYMKMSLGRLYQRLGVWETSGTLLSEANEVYKKGYGAAHPLEWIQLNHNLASYHMDISEYQIADSLLSMCFVRIDETAFPLTYAHLQVSRSNLRYKQGEYEEGARVAAGALQVLSSLSKDYHETGSNYTAGQLMVLAYQRRGKNLRALSRYDDALEASLKAVELGAQYKEQNLSLYRIPLNELSVLYGKMSRYDEQVAIQEDLVSLLKNLLPIDSRILLSEIGNLAAAYFNVMDYTQSDSLNLLVYQSYLSKGEENNQHAVGVLYNLANSMYQQDQFSESRDYFLKILEADIAALGEEHPYVGGDYTSLGLAELGLDNHLRAERYFLMAYDIYISKFGEQHQKVSYCHWLLARTYVKMSRTDQANFHFEQAVSLSKSVLGETHQYYLKYKKSWEDYKRAGK